MKEKYCVCKVYTDWQFLSFYKVIKGNKQLTQINFLCTEDNTFRNQQQNNIPNQLVTIDDHTEHSTKRTIPFQGLQ